MTKTARELIARLQGPGIGLKQTEISAKTGIPQSRISRWANSGAPVAVDSALKLQALVDEYDAKARRAFDARAGRRRAAKPKARP